MAKKYNCKTCGAELFFDPKSGKLHCEYCGSSFDPSEYDMPSDGSASPDEMIPQPEGEPDEPSDLKASDESVSLDDLVVYKCPHCGAEVITSKKTVATTCVYCNRAITMTGNIKGDFHPDYVLPFEKDRSEVEAAYKKLCRESFLTPRLFTTSAQIQKIKGMYIPYWLYSFNGEASMDVMATRVRTYVSGHDQVTETSRYDLHEEASGYFYRIPADAMKEMDNLMMDSIEPFDFSKLVPFNPAYLSGFYTQQWDENAAANEPRAKERAKSALNAEMMKNFASYTTSAIKSENFEWSNQTVEQILIPVWMMYTEYKGKNYVFGMNGQTGKMMGTIPQDPVRIVEVGAVLFIISQIVMLILRLTGVM